MTGPIAGAARPTVPASVPGTGRATAPAAPASPDVAAAKKTAEKFEAVFLGQMTQLMMESVEVGDQFSGGHGEQMFRGILAEKLGTAMASQGGIGLAPAVMAQIIKMQGGSDSGQ